MTPDELQTQLDVLHDLRQPVSYDRFATPKMLQKLNIALRELVGEENRIEVLRRALAYTETFTSTKQLHFSDAHGLIEFLWEQGDDPKSPPTKGLAVRAFQELKRQIEEARYEQVIA